MQLLICFQRATAIGLNSLRSRVSALNDTRSRTDMPISAVSRQLELEYRFSDPATSLKACDRLPTKICVRIDIDEIS